MKKGKIGHLMLICGYILVLLIVSTSFAWFFINKELEVDYDTENCPAAHPTVLPDQLPVC